MKTRTSLATLLALMLVTGPGCKKDRDSQPAADLLVQSVSSTETISYVYDENNRLTRYLVDNVVPANSYTAAFTYNGSGQLAEVRFNPASSVEDKKDVYSYNDNGQIAKIESYYVTNVYSSLYAKYEADYSTAGKVSVYKFTSAGAGTPYLETEYMLDSKGNIQQQLSYSVTGNLTVTTENSEFDNKKIASASLPQTGFVRNTNNYRKVTVTPAGGSPSVTTYTYEYDADGYPTKRTSSTGSEIRYGYLKK